MSMAAVLAGLFPPKETALEWNRKLNWQPIPIFSEPLDEDTVSKYIYRIFMEKVLKTMFAAAFSAYTMSSLL